MVGIVADIMGWMADRANNALWPGSELPAFDAPLVGFAAGARRNSGTVARPHGLETMDS